MSKEICIKIRKEIQEQFAEKDVKLLAKDIDPILRKLMFDFKVPADEAKRSAIKQLSKDHNVKIATGGTSDNAKVNDLTNDKWVNLEVVVKQIWDSTSESINQTGLIADESGAIKFTSWTNAGMPKVEEGKSYTFKNVVVNEYNEKLAINLNKTSSIEPLDKEIEAGSTDVTITGVMVGIKPGSGLIKRCSECNKALQKGACKEHGKVEGVNDLRIMAIIDDGITATDIIADRSITEELMNTTLDQCQAVAAEALDPSVILEQFKNKLVGKYYTVTGPNYNVLLVKEIEQLVNVDATVTDELIATAKEMM